MEILFALLIFSLGIIVGFLFRWWLIRYSGVILVDKTTDKIVYSIVLDDDPEDLQFKKGVAFKVKIDTSNDSHIRD